MTDPRGNQDQVHTYLARRKRRMLKEDLAHRGITEPRVLEAFENVPREAFVPERQRLESYEDRPLNIGCEQTISQPYMVALMTQELALTGSERVLEIGTGSGYQTAVLARLARDVCTIERFPDLAAAAARVLASLGITNVSQVVADGPRGWPGPPSCRRRFDRIIVTAGAPAIPDPLADQLADGGILVIPVGDRHHQMLIRATRRGDHLIEKSVCGCVFVRLVGEHGWRAT